MVHCGIFNKCIVGFVRWVYSRSVHYFRYGYFSWNNQWNNTSNTNPSAYTSTSSIFCLYDMTVTFTGLPVFGSVGDVGVQFEFFVIMILFYSHKRQRFLFQLNIWIRRIVIFPTHMLQNSYLNNMCNCQPVNDSNNGWNFFIIRPSPGFRYTCS